MVKKDRQSIAFFVHFDHGSTVTPLEDLEAHPISHGKVYSEVQSDEYVRGRLNNTIKIQRVPVQKGLVFVDNDFGIQVSKTVPMANENQETI